MIWKWIGVGVYMLVLIAIGVEIAVRGVLAHAAHFVTSAGIAG